MALYEPADDVGWWSYAGNHKRLYNDDGCAAVALSMGSPTCCVAVCMRNQTKQQSLAYCKHGHGLDDPAHALHGTDFGKKCNSAENENTCWKVNPAAEGTPARKKRAGLKRQPAGRKP